ncbi:MULTISPECIES: tRNA lysidine(34) synthetase TilS [unclassified Campylobacter]|uniref:tRNA lysidine(34) synthetase TilS n=1 Tax=unclassified Campylobacter TaxID=2593542 RepID=UPI001237B64A|nr:MULTISPECIES: tRNA lysidine(34) synthetase TilS [unclassified Campylobacter]KAA6224864.1 tRNA lysidine(34) synthetase TilS [Campylobacter sp. LR286c]KAA6233492.1 tRNA lysidine(34) synthetase TilS [Campylobacter sp. LR291e]
MKIELKYLRLLRGKKNLLAFSYGGDSRALFECLLRQNISFDLALINYKTRKQSDLEEKKAKELASKFNKQIFTKTAPKFKNNFESKAREFRYAFFKELCEKKGYENVLLAHQLNDNFEWFLMQFSKGAGFLELSPMQDIVKKDNFLLIRPFLNFSKNEILAFLKQNNIFYFEDESNENEKFKRNYIRKHFSNEFINNFERGVKKSFEYINKDLSLLNTEILEFKGILYCAINESVIARAVKRFGIVMSAKQRKESKKDCVISAKLGICYAFNKAFIFNFENALKMPKSFKEECRINKIPKLLRPYLFNHNVNIKEFLARVVV